MLARNVAVLGLSALFAFAVGCGAPPDGTTKDGQRVGGSPNDPGWVPPGANPGSGPDDTTGQPGDDQGEQPTGNPNPNCPPMAAATVPDGWTMRTTRTMTMATPSDWMTPTLTDPTADGGLFWEEFSLHPGETVHYSVGMADFVSRTSLDEEFAAEHAVLIGKSGTVRAVTRTDTTFGCDPAMRVVGVGTQTAMVTVFFSVLHDGHVFTASCESDQTRDTTLCDQILATFRLTD